MPYSMTSEQKERALSLILVTGPAIKCGIHARRGGAGRGGGGEESLPSRLGDADPGPDV
ncbi:hypothetical protein J6590_076473 [Homalodisca vitripennis]|nr:hypothetical protein J6590_076473 [Homalodisca vitripennis]